jgi:hypothetical protein
MEIQPGQPANPPGQLFIRWGLRGGALAALIPLTVGLIANISGMAVVATLGFGAVAGAATLTIGALIFRRRQISLNYVENDLQRARSMIERHLISEDEYLHLKSQILAHYQPGQSRMPNLWPVVYWGAVLGMIGCAVIVNASADSFGALMAAGIAGAVGGVVTGATAQAYALAQGAAARFRLPAPTEQRRLLDE